ncbi:MAG TPA: hypothetical protein VEZ70_05155 [Allosphingosinicella sp.]|nr:hypothetical protein [Allosphingosinicella sp.]
MRLSMENDSRQEITEQLQLRGLLATLNGDDNNFAILEKGEDEFLQAAVTADGFIIEKRDLGADRLSCGVRPGPAPAAAGASSPPKTGEQGQHVFSRDEMMEVFTAYWSGGGEPGFLAWKEMGGPQACERPRRVRQPQAVAADWNSVGSHRALAGLRLTMIRSLLIPTRGWLAFSAWSSAPIRGRAQFGLTRR